MPLSGVTIESPRIVERSPDRERCGDRSGRGRKDDSCESAKLASPHEVHDEHERDRQRDRGEHKARDLGRRIGALLEDLVEVYAESTEDVREDEHDNRGAEGYQHRRHEVESVGRRPHGFVDFWNVDFYSLHHWSRFGSKEPSMLPPSHSSAGLFVRSSFASLHRSMRRAKVIATAAPTAAPATTSVNQWARR